VLHPQSRVTFGGTQLRNCSVSSGSPRSSTSGSCCSRQCDVFPTGKSFEARQIRSSSLSEVEDFQVSCFAQSHSANSRTDVDTDMFGRCKKAKIVREKNVQGGSPFVHSAGNRSQSFASLEQSLTETDVGEFHFWHRRIHSPEVEESFVRCEEDDVESPLRRIDKDRSSYLKTYDELASSWQADSNHNKCGRGVNDDYHHQHKIDVNSFAEGRSVVKECMPASNLQSPAHYRDLSTDIHTVTSDAKSPRSEDVEKADRSRKWWAFVSGITSELPGPGYLLFFTF